MISISHSTFYHFRALFLVFFFLLFPGKPVGAKELPASLEDSIKTELSRCKHDTGRFKLYHSLFWKYFNTNFEKSKQYGEKALHYAETFDNPKLKSDALDLQGVLLGIEGKVDSAFECYQRALPLAKKAGYKLRIAWCYNNMGEILDRKGMLDSALINFKLAKLYFDDNRNIYQQNYKIAGCFQKLAKFDSAEVYILQNIRMDSLSGKKGNQIYAYLNLALAYVKTNNYQKSVSCLNRALSLAEELKNDTISLVVFVEIGNFLCRQKKNYSLAIDYFNKALVLAERHKMRTELSMINFQIGKAYIEDNKSEIALQYNLRSLKIANEINWRHSKSDAYLNLAYNYKELGREKLALYNFVQCWQTQCDRCPAIAFHNALIEIGDIYRKQKKYPEAKKWYDKSLDLAESFHAKNELALSNFKIGGYFQENSRDLLTEQYYLRSFQLSREVKNVQLLKTISDSLVQFYLNHNNCKRAKFYISLSNELGDSLNNAEKKANIETFEIKLAFENLNKENEARQKDSLRELEKQKIYRNFLFVVSILLSVIGVVIFVSYKRKKQDNKLLLSRKNEIERISKQLHDADELKLRFFTNISHELRTPLTLIVSPLKKLLKITGDENSKDLLSLMLRNTQKLQSLINQLLDISKLDKGELRLNLCQGNLNKLIVVNAAMFQSIAEEKRIEFRLIENDKNMVFGFDAARIDQVCNNLLSNAFKFTHEGGKISLEIGVNRLENRNYAEIKIWDNGVGIPSEDVDKVFDRFYQSDSTITGNFEGSGIGLSFAKELVALHGGKISVASEPGKFTEFTVLLPMTNVDGPIKTEDEEIEDDAIGLEFLFSSKKTETGNHQKGKCERVLVVEDNVDLRGYLNSFLSEKYELILACNGKEGIESAMAKVPDLIISDVMMPEIDGYQLTQAIKNNIETSHIPVILLTAKAGRDSKIEGLEKGADDYLSKPFDEDELLLKVRNILNNRHILQERYRKQIKVVPSDVSVKSLEEQFLLKLTSIVEKEISNPDLDVDFLSCEMGMSRPQLYRKLKALTDLSINHFICSIRLKRAAQLLEKKSASVSEVAFSTGFENLSYFTKKFKEEFGKVPSEY